MAMAPNGSWLTTGSSGDGTVRIRDTNTWQATAMMRVDSKIRDLAWAGDGTLAIAGSAGLHLFDVLDAPAESTLVPADATFAPKRAEAGPPEIPG